MMCHKFTRGTLQYYDPYFSFSSDTFLYNIYKDSQGLSLLQARFRNRQHGMHAMDMHLVERLT